MLEIGDYPTIREIAAAEKINETYVGRHHDGGFGDCRVSVRPARARGDRSWNHRLQGPRFSAVAAVLATGCRVDVMLDAVTVLPDRRPAQREPELLAMAAFCDVGF